MAAGRQHERDAAVGEAVGDRPDLFAVLQVHVDDGDIEAALLDLVQGVATVSTVPAT
jgi:hypothetical protein